MYKYLIIIFLTTLAPALSFAQKADSVLFGNGGGFTGQVTAYRITKNTIEKGKGITSISYSSKAGLRKKEFKKIQAEASKIYKSTDSFTHPGNTYSFLEIYSAGNSKKFVWGSSDFTVPEYIREFYNKLITTSTK